MGSARPGVLEWGRDILAKLALTPGPGGPDVFTGYPVPTPWGRLYGGDHTKTHLLNSFGNMQKSQQTAGGQAVAQSLLAAGRTVPAELQAQSLHGYFTNPGNLSEPLEFEVRQRSSTNGLLRDPHV